MRERSGFSVHTATSGYATTYVSVSAVLRAQFSFCHPRKFQATTILGRFFFLSANLTVVHYLCKVDTSDHFIKNQLSFVLDLIQLHANEHIYAEKMYTEQTLGVEMKSLNQLANAIAKSDYIILYM